MAYIGGVGIPLQYPFNNYGYQPTGGTNRFTLNAGNTFLIPSGRWLISPGRYGFLQFLDPVSGLWVNHASMCPNTAIPMDSDGANFRVANLTGTVLGAVMTTNGTGYTSAPVVTASAGGSSWTAIVGGALVPTVTVAGSNYTLPPLVSFPAPPIGGVQATGYATLSGSTVNAVIMTNSGAGYIVAPAPIFATNPLDPSAGTVVTAVGTTSITASAGTITAVLCTYNGTVQTTMPTLSFAGGGGASAAATVVGCYAVTGFTNGTSGVGYVAGVYSVTASGGYTTVAAATYNSPDINSGLFIPRPASTLVTATTGATSITSLVDSGLYQNTTATAVLVSPAQATAPTTAAAFTIAFGGVNTTVTIQAI